MQYDELNKKILLLSSSEGKHTGRSGYSVIADFLPGTTMLEVTRKIPVTLSERLVDAVLGRTALSKWYKKSSFKLERLALQHIKQHGIELVHLLWGDRDIGFLHLFKKKYQFKICCTIHNCANMLDGIFNFPARLKSIDQFILMSETQRSFLLKAGVPDEKITVLLHGIDNDYFRPPVVKKENNVFRVLSVGSWQRDFDLLSEVCRQLQNRIAVEIVIVAPEKFRNYFSGIEAVKFETGLTNEELLKTYQGADCFIMTAKDTSANNAILEAMACGLPIVAERIGGIPEYVNEKCALLCTSKSVAEICDAIVQIASSKSLRQQLSEQAKLRALQLDWKTTSAQMQEVYGKMLN